MKTIVSMLLFLVSASVFSTDYIRVSVTPTETFTSIGNTATHWTDFSRSYYTSLDSHHQQRAHHDTLRGLALGGMPIFYLTTEVFDGTLLVPGSTYYADQWLRAAGDATTTVARGPDWLENPLYTPDERKLHHLLKSVPHIDKVRFVHRDKVVAPPDTRTAELDEDGEEIPLSPYEPTEVTIVMWPEWTLWNQGKTVKVSKIVVNKTSGRLTFHSDNPTTLGDATITLRQGTVTASGSPVSSSLTTGCGKLHQPRRERHVGILVLMKPPVPIPTVAETVLWAVLALVYWALE